MAQSGQKPVAILVCTRLRSEPLAKAELTAKAAKQAKDFIAAHKSRRPFYLPGMVYMAWDPGGTPHRSPPRNNRGFFQVVSRNFTE